VPLHNSKNGQTVTGTNQENAAYPVGICAERVLLSSAATLFPGIAIDTLAIKHTIIKTGKVIIPFRRAVYAAKP